MSNSYFRFKQFTIQQSNCAMKVCTDSCLFGAWAADWIMNNKKEVKQVLDIGAGTGLLSLLLAQKLPAAIIDAVEFEPACSHQANCNVLQSPWSNRIQVYNDNINQFFPQKQYDFIISNPPFYESDLQSTQPEKNMAHHSTRLTLFQFITAIKRLLTEEGCFAVLLPHRRIQAFEKIANEEGFFANKKTFVKQTETHSFFRVMSVFSKSRTEILEDEIIITAQNKQYSESFVFLLKDYYLHL